MHTVTIDGVTFERGGQLVNTDHTDMQALRKAFWHRPDRSQERRAPHDRSSDGAAIPDGELADGLRRIAARIDADAKALDADFARVAPRLDRMSMAQYLDAHPR